MLKIYNKNIFNVKQTEIFLNRQRVHRIK